MKGCLCWLWLVLLAAPLNGLAAPQQLQLRYELRQQGNPIAKVEETLQVTGKQYVLTSTTTGLGLFKLMGERRVISRGSIVNKTLRPDHFEVQQSKRPNKALINDFDWRKKRLLMQIKGEQSSIDLPAGAQDLLSLMYVWMWQAPPAKPFSLAVSNGKRLRTHTFTLSAEASPLETQAGHFQVLKLSDEEGEKMLYLAKEKGNLPVKIVVMDDGKQMEQVITSISGQ